MVKYLDLGPGPSATTLVVGSARSGTTWTGAVVSKMMRARPIFEPFVVDKNHEFALTTRPRSKVDVSQKGRCLYIEPTLGRTSRYHSAIEAILSGRVRHEWTDRDVWSSIFTRRMIKGIRANLLLPYIIRNWPRLPIVWVVRNPIDVITSQMIMRRRYGWPHEPFELVSEGNVDPWLSDALSNMRRAASLAEELAHRWVIETMMPLRAEVHLHPKVALAFYDDLATDITAWQPVSHLVSGAIWDGDKLSVLLAEPSSTSRALLDPSLTDQAAGPSPKDIRSIRQIIQGYGLPDVPGVNRLERVFTDYDRAEVYR